MLKRTITWAVVIFLAFYLLFQPDAAAGIIHGFFGVLKDAGNSLADFVNSL